jgi:hypothetical protein
LAPRVVPKQTIGLRLHPRYIRVLRVVAERKGLPYQALIQMWLVERLWEDVPQLMGSDATRSRRKRRV